MKLNSLGVGSARRRRPGALCLVTWLASAGLLCATGVADLRWWREVGLAGPVDFELAQAVEALPAENVLPSGSRYEKWDGFLR